MSQQYRFWVHSCKVFNGVDEAIIVKEKIADVDDDGKITFSNHLNTIVNPKRTFYIHQNKYRNYKYKIEYAPISECDAVQCYNKELDQALKRELRIFSNKHMTMRDLCNSPYVYGADIDIEVLIKIRYLKRLKDVTILPKFTFGALDLEVSVLGDDRIMLSSYSVMDLPNQENTVYCFILNDFLYKPSAEKDENGNPKREKASLEELIQVVNEEIGDRLDKFKFKVEYKLCSNEMELIKNTLDIIHKTEVDFCGVWNMPYDIPKLMERIKANGQDPSEYFCDPNVPKEFRKMKYKVDHSQTDHFTDSWDWCHCPGHTQYVDSMRLYSRLRKVKGREPSYRLGFISMKEVGFDKLDLEGTHYYNQLYNFLHYTAYNIIDAVNVSLMEQKNGDVTSMTQLVGCSLLSDFSKQTIMLKNDFYSYCYDRGLISGTVGATMGTPYDDLMSKAGGTVLPPYLARDMGLKCVSERPNLHTLVNIFIKDIDASSIYPNTLIGFNISKETNVATMIDLDNFKKADIEELFIAMTAPEENALLIGNKFFNLPSAEELLELDNQWLIDRAGRSKSDIMEELAS